MALILGGVVFQDFEIPERMPFGGDHQLVVHKFPGGGRQIDSMGPDNKDITWSGRFRGETAEERARLLDFMRSQGQPLALSWGAFLYQVIIRSYDPDFEQSYEIPYRITCAVVADAAQAIANAVVGFLDAMASDLINATGIGSIVGSSAINTAVSTVAGAFTNLKAGVPASTNAMAAGTSVAQAPLFSALQGSLAGAQAVTQSAMTVAGASITSGSVGGLVAGGSVTGMASGLVSQASSFLHLDKLSQISNSLSRMAVNTVNAQASGSTVLH